MLAVVIATALAGSPASAPPTERAFTFTGPSGKEHDAVLVVPGEPSGVGVLLIGGGLATDLHWTVPGSFEDAGQVTRFTIDGADTRDADAIAGALAGAGFVVMRWSSIFRGDPLHEVNPAMATVGPYADTVPLAARALEVLRAQPEVERVALVGHSLGATRAWQIADGDVVAIVTLAGAYTSRLRGTPSEMASGAWVPEADVDGNGALDGMEFAARALWIAPGLAFDAIDFDQDGLVRAWELAAAARLARLEAGDRSDLADSPLFKGGLPWPIDRAEALRIPWLALCGGLDPISVHGPLIDRWKKSGSHDQVVVEYFPALGHQLAPQEGELTGRISPEVVARLTSWLRDRAR